MSDENKNPPKNENGPISMDEISRILGTSSAGSDSDESKKADEIQDEQGIDDLLKSFADESDVQKRPKMPWEREGGRMIQKVDFRHPRNVRNEYEKKLFDLIEEACDLYSSKSGKDMSVYPLDIEQGMTHLEYLLYVCKVDSENGEEESFHTYSLSVDGNESFCEFFTAKNSVWDNIHGELLAALEKVFAKHGVSFTPVEHNPHGKTTPGLRVCICSRDKNDEIKSTSVFFTQDFVNKLFKEKKETHKEKIMANIDEIAVEVEVKVGKAKMSIADLKSLNNGRIITFDTLEGEALPLLANGVPVAKGELVVIDENLALRVTEVD